MRAIYISIVFIFLICSNHIVFGQANITILEAPLYNMPCDSSCVTLHCNYLKTKLTDNYTVDTIPYNPIPIPGAINVNLGDDSFSAPINIGFVFCFYGFPYTNLVIGSNGVVTFNTTFAGGNCSFRSYTPIPYISSTFPNNAILCPFMDLAPNIGGQVKYKLIGTAPFRRFIIRYDNIPLFGNLCTANTNTFDLILYETYNKIEMHVDQKENCNTNPADSLNYATIGIQGITPATQWLAAPGKNASMWTANDKAFKFEPAGANNGIVEWIVNNITVSLNPDSFVYCLPYGTNSKDVIAKYTSYCPYASTSDTVTITKYKPSIDSFKFTKPDCQYSTNGSITLYGSSINNPITYSINGSPFSSNFTNNNIPANQVISLLIKDALGCIDSAIVTLVPKSKVNLVIDSLILGGCDSNNSGAIVDAIDGIPPYSFTWETGATGNTILNMPGDTFITVYVTDSIGCVDSMIVPLLKDKPAILIDSLKKPACPKSNGYINLKIENGTPPYTFLWYNGDTTSYQDSLAANTTYSVLVTDANGCTNSYSVYLQYDSLPQIKFTSIKPTCDKANGTLSVSSNIGVPPFTYLWSNGATTNPATGLDSNNYVVTVTDFYGCSSAAAFLLKDTLEMVSNIFGFPTTCNYANGQANVTANLGMAPYTYLWSNGATTFSITNVAAGTYTCIISDALACIDTLVTTVAPSAPLSVSSIIVQPTCDTSNGSISVTIAGSIGWPNKLWNTGDTTSLLAYKNAGTYILTVTDAIGCSNTAVYNLVNEGKPFASIVNFIPVKCYGDTTGQLTLNAVNGTSPYKYSLDGVNYVTVPTITGISGGIYTLFVKDDNGCVNDTIINLFQPPPITLSINNLDTQKCFTDLAPFLQFVASGGTPTYTYSFDNGPFNLTTTYTNVSVGTHTVAVKDSYECLSYFPIKIPGPDTPLQIIISKQDVPCFQKNSGWIKPTIIGGWSSNYSILWNNGDTTLNKDSLVFGTYSISVTDAKGCSTSATIDILQNECCEIWLPNAFTPNGDGVNDVYKIIPKAKISELNFMIVDRWGNQVFKTNDVNTGWNGEVNGKADASTDVYFYIVQYKCPFDTGTFTLKGDVTLIK
jgi:gliding motility-associated-like protein